MIYSFKVEKAIRAASILHGAERRKGRAGYPYVSHVFSVALILADYTDDEDILISALLHETLERSDYSEEELQSDFGPRVREIVVALTEKKGKDASASAWKARKLKFIERLETAPREALIVAAADMIHNFRSIVEEYGYDLEAFNKDFPGSNQDRIEAYGRFHAFLNGNLDDPILDEFNTVYREYRNFLQA